MNREIKFRVWNNWVGCWEECLDDPKNKLCINNGSPLYRLPLKECRKRYQDNPNRKHDEYPFATLSNIFGSPDAYNVQQFTNVVDTMGVEVYEGDIVSFRDGKDDFNRFGFVFWSKEYLTYLVQFEIGEYEYCSEYLYRINMKNFNVIGNVFQNKNLIREELVKKYFNV